MNTIKPFIPSRWHLMSALQKGIRRGRLDIATNAVRVLHRTEPSTVYRRLCVTAVEDLGVGSLELVHRVLTAGTTNLPKLCDLTEAMALSVKDRSACDIAEAVNSNIGGHAIAIEAARLLATRSIGTGDDLAQEVARIGFRITKEPLTMLLPFVANMAKTDSGWKADIFTNYPLIHGMPSEVFDLYSKEGKQANRLALKTHPALRTNLERFVDPSKVADLLNYALFVVSSGKLDKRLTYPGSDEVLRLGHQADICRWGVPLKEVQTVISIVEAAMPVIHEARCQTLNYREHSLPDTNSGAK